MKTQSFNLLPETEKEVQQVLSKLKSCTAFPRPDCNQCPMSENGMPTGTCKIQLISEAVNAIEELYRKLEIATYLLERNSSEDELKTGRSIVTSADVKYTVLALNKKKILLLRAGKLCNTFIIGHNPKYQNNELTWDYGQYFDCFNKNEGHMLKLAAQAYEEI